MFRSLYVQVLIGIALGVILGATYPEAAVAMKPLGDGFIKLVKMLITPIVFTTVVVGIGQMGAMKDVGRVGFRALVYFEVVSTLALVVGLVVVTIVQPGAGMHVDPSTLDASGVAAYTSGAAHSSVTEFLLNIIPDSVVGAFARGDILQVLLFSVLFGLAMLHLQPGSAPLVALLEALAHGLFAVVGLVMRLAPIGAFGAMAFTIGRYGLGTLLSLGKLMAAVYITCLLFVIVVLGAIVRAHRLQHLQAGALRPRGTADRARHLVVGVGAAARDGQDGAPRLRQVGRRPGGADRLFVQPRWHGHLHDDGGGVRGAGDRRAAVASGDAVDPRAAAGDVEGRRRRDRQRLHHARGDAGGGARAFRWRG